MSYEVLMVVAFVGFIIGVVYGKITASMKWRNNIANSCITTYLPDLNDVITTERIQGVEIGDEPVYAISRKALLMTWGANVAPYVPVDDDMLLEEHELSDIFAADYHTDHTPVASDMEEHKVVA